MSLYPWMLHKVGGQGKLVTNDAEKAAAEADGWTVEDPDQVPPPVSPEPVADAPVEKPKGKKKA